MYAYVHEYVYMSLIYMYMCYVYTHIIKTTFTKCSPYHAGCRWIF